ncbi:MAG TPA: tetratricopeptide repeat protein [Pirellulales bacterium]|nr:tetratricopeptide repeat protein [Pirellulales bacterium]
MDSHHLPTGSRNRPHVHWDVLAGIVILVVATSLAYLPAWNGGFILDDDGLLLNNPLVQAPDGLYRLWFTTQSQDYWPLTYTTFWLEWRLWGNHPAGYHAVNLVLHIGESLLIWLIISRLSIPGGFLAAALFALHPVNVESVAWISQRKNTLSLLFFLLSILWYLKSDRSLTNLGDGSADPLAQSTRPASPRKAGWYLLSLFAFVLACLSKGSVVILPLILLAIIAWKRPATKRDLIRLIPLVIVAVVFAALNVWFQKLATPGVIRTAGMEERTLGAGAAVWFYLYKAMWPFDLAFIYPLWQIEPQDWQWWLPLMAAVAVTAILVLKRSTAWGRAFLLAWVFFCIALLPVLGFTDVGFMRFSLVADHYQHVAIIAVVALVAAGWSRWRHSSSGATILAANAVTAAILCTLAYLTWRQSSLYRDARTIYTAAIEKNPNCWMLHGNLGDALLDEGETAAATEQLNIALQLNLDSFDAHCNLGVALFKLHQPAAAIQHLRRAVELKPTMQEAYHQLTMIYVETNQPELALATAEKALSTARSLGQDSVVADITAWEQKYKAHQPNLKKPVDPKSIQIEH